MVEEERKTRTRRTPGRCRPQRLTLQLSWTARCVPLVDRYLPPKTLTPTRPCTSGRMRSSLPCNQLAVSSASPLFFFLCSVRHFGGQFSVAPAALQQPVWKTAACFLCDHVPVEFGAYISNFLNWNLRWFMMFVVLWEFC